MVHLTLTFTFRKLIELFVTGLLSGVSIYLALLGTTLHEPERYFFLLLALVHMFAFQAILRNKFILFARSEGTFIYVCFVLVTLFYIFVPIFFPKFFWDLFVWD